MGPVAAKTRRPAVKPRRKPLSPDTVVATLSRFGSWFVTVDRVAEACGASAEQVHVRLRALHRARVVESAECAKFGSKRPVYTWRLRRA